MSTKIILGAKSKKQKVERKNLFTSLKFGSVGRGTAVELQGNYLDSPVFTSQYSK